MQGGHGAAHLYRSRRCLRLRYMSSMYCRLAPPAAPEAAFLGGPPPTDSTGKRGSGGCQAAHVWRQRRAVQADTRTGVQTGRCGLKPCRQPLGSSAARSCLTPTAHGPGADLSLRQRRRPGRQSRPAGTPGAGACGPWASCRIPPPRRRPRPWAQGRLLGKGAQGRGGDACSGAAQGRCVTLELGQRGKTSKAAPAGLATGWLPVGRVHPVLRTHAVAAWPAFRSVMTRPTAARTAGMGAAAHPARPRRPCRRPAASPAGSAPAPPCGGRPARRRTQSGTREEPAGWGGVGAWAWVLGGLREERLRADGAGASGGLHTWPHACTFCTAAAGTRERLCPASPCCSGSPHHAAHSLLPHLHRFLPSTYTHPRPAAPPPLRSIAPYTPAVLLPPSRPCPLARPSPTTRLTISSRIMRSTSLSASCCASASWKASSCWKVSAATRSLQGGGRRRRDWVTRPQFGATQLLLCNWSRVSHAVGQYGGHHGGAERLRPSLVGRRARQRKLSGQAELPERWVLAVIQFERCRHAVGLAQRAAAACRCGQASRGRRRRGVRIGT